MSVILLLTDWRQRRYYEYVNEKCTRHLLWCRSAR